MARALLILECLASEPPGLPLAEVARRARLPKSTAFRFLFTLETLGYVARSADETFAPGDKVTALARATRRPLDVCAVAQPVMERLAQRSGECVTLHMLLGRQRVCIAAVNAKPSATDVNRIGERHPLGLGGASLVLMAYQEPDVLVRMLPAISRASGCSKRELTSILQHVRMQGYATSHGGGVHDLSGIAAPVFDGRGVACFSLAILVPSRQVRGRVAQLGQLVREGAAEISVMLIG